MKPVVERSDTTGNSGGQFYCLSLAKTQPESMKVYSHGTEPKVMGGAGVC
jgi:hypothetical protein